LRNIFNFVMFGTESNTIITDGRAKDLTRLALNNIANDRIEIRIVMS
jgi:hypothetical protein